MRGDDIHQDAMFSYLSPEARVPKDHPLRLTGHETALLPPLWDSS